MIDLVEMKALVWDSDDKDAQWQVLEVTPDLADKLHITVPSDRAAAWPMCRSTAPSWSTPASSRTMRRWKRTSPTVPCPPRTCCGGPSQGHLDSAFTPVLCGSSYKNKGVQQVLDAVVDYLPAPTDVASIKTVDADGEPIGERKCSDDEPFAALAFKVINDAYGALTFIRVYSGRADQGRLGPEFHPRQAREDRPHGRDVRQGSQSGGRGARGRHHCARVAGGDRDRRYALRFAANPVVLERMRFPDPVISVSVKAKTKAEQEKFGTALGKMVRADPSLHLETDRETGQTILRGMGELHLEVTLDRMRTEFGVEGIMGEPQVAYRETFTKKLTEQYIHKKQTGGAGQFAEVWIDFRAPAAQCGFRVRR